MIKRFFAPGNDPALTSLALLVLRLWLGLSMFFIHGLDKLEHYNAMAAHFANPIGIGVKPSLILVIIAEVGGAWLLTLGLLSRLGALMLAIDMGVAFFAFHKMALSTGPHPGDLPFVYLAGFVTLLLAGPGKFSLDRALFGKGK
ncbi:MAG: DoxX family protein [Limisphaerales bacterium]